MKKNIRNLLALALIVALLLCGCGSEDPKGNVTPNETTVPETTAPAENALTLGRMDGGVYTNTYAGLSCTLDESWTFYSAEELQEMPEVIKELAEGTDIADKLGEMQQYTDMAAENAELLCNMNLLLTKLDLQSRLIYLSMTEQEIMDEMMTQKDLMISSYAQMGITVNSMELKTVTFAGQERVALYSVCESQGVPMYMTQIMDYHRGGYGITLTMTSFVEDNTETMLALFEAAE